MSDMYYVLRCIGHKSLELRQGTTLKIGRDESNDLVLRDPTVSRNHLVLQWDADQALPVMIVNSPAGVELGDHLVEDEERAFVTKGVTLGVGDYTVVLQQKGKKKQMRPATASRQNLAEDENRGGFRLFSESTVRMKGAFKASATLHKVLLSIESAGRTGTLEISEGGKKTTRAIFGQGRLITVHRDGAEGRPAFDAMMSLAAGEFLFSASIEPCEDNLDISIKDHLNSSS